MGVKVFNWTSKKKLVMLKHMVSMVINKAILKNWVYQQKYSKLTSNAFYDTKLGTKLVFYLKGRFAKNFSCIINELVEKLKFVPTKLAIYQLLTITF